MVRKYAIISLLVNIFQKIFCPFKRYAVKKYAIKLTAQGRSKKKSATLKRYAMVRKYAMISLLVNIFQKKFCPFKRYAVKKYAIKLTI